MYSECRRIKGLVVQKLKCMFENLRNNKMGGNGTCMGFFKYVGKGMTNLLKVLYGQRRVFLNNGDKG